MLTREGNDDILTTNMPTAVTTPRFSGAVAALMTVWTVLWGLPRAGWLGMEGRGGIFVVYVVCRFS
jgi:hypothetical protein